MGRGQRKRDVDDAISSLSKKREDEDKIDVLASPFEYSDRFRRQASSSSSSSTNSSGRTGSLDTPGYAFCHRFRPTWNDALLGAAVAVALHIVLALLFQLTAFLGKFS